MELTLEDKSLFCDKLCRYYDTNTRNQTHKVSGRVFSIHSIVTLRLARFTIFLAKACNATNTRY